MMNTGGGWGERFMPIGGQPSGGGMHPILQRLLGMFGGGSGGVTHGNIGPGATGGVSPMPASPLGGGMMQQGGMPQNLQGIIQMLSGLNGRMGFGGPTIPGGGRVM